MARDLVTRSDLRRALALNAVTRPVNVLVPAAVAVAAAVIGAPWLLAISGVSGGTVGGSSTGRRSASSARCRA